jgi:Domain of unknown function (DUF4331)
MVRIRTLSVVLAFLLAGAALASSHREALAVINEPCADNTDTYAWVSDGAHDKLYLIMNFNPLHEPGQGNQGFRACHAVHHGHGVRTVAFDPSSAFGTFSPRGGRRVPQHMSPFAPACGGEGARRADEGAS